MKRKLVDFACKYSISATNAQDFSAAKRLLNMATTLTGKHRDLLSSKVTVLINSAYLKKCMGEAEQALAFLERAEIIANKSNEKLDLASVRVNKAAVLRALGLDYRATAELQETVAMLEPIIGGAKSRASDDDLKRSSWFKKSISLLLVCNTERLKLLNLNSSEAQLLLSRSMELAELYLKPTHSLVLKLRTFETVSRPESSSSGSLVKARSFNSFSSSEEVKVISKESVAKARSDESTKSYHPTQPPVPEKHRPEEFFQKRRTSKFGCIKEISSPQLDMALLSKSFVKIDSDSSSRRHKPADDPLSTSVVNPDIRSRSSTPSSRHCHTEVSKSTVKLPKLAIENVSPKIPKLRISPQGTKDVSLPSKSTPKRKVTQAPSLAQPSPFTYQFSEETAQDRTFLVDTELNYLNLKGSKKCCQVIGSERSAYFLTATLDTARQNIYIQAEGLGPAARSVAPECVQLTEYSSIVNMLRIDTVLPRAFLLRFITNFASFISYAVFPFIQLKEVQGIMRIEIWEHSRSLLGPVELVFLKKKCFADLLHIEGRCLRLIINQVPENLNAQHTVDVELDEFSAKLMLRDFEIPTRGTIDYVRPSYKPIDSKNFKHFIGVIRLLEKHLEEYGVLHQASIVASRAVIVGPGFNVQLWVVSDRRDISAWVVHFYKGDSKLTWDYSYESVRLNFGVRLDRLCADERSLVANCLLDTMRVEMQGRRPVIVAEEIDEGPAFQITLPSNGAVRVITIGYSQRILGFKVLWDNRQAAQYGAFIHMNGVDFETSQAHPKAKFSEYVENFTSLPAFMTEGGLESIKKAIQVDPSYDDLYLLDGRKQMVSLDSATNVLQLKF